MAPLTLLHCSCSLLQLSSTARRAWLMCKPAKQRGRLQIFGRKFCMMLQLVAWQTRCAFLVHRLQAYQRSSYDEDEDKPRKTCKCMLLDVTLPTSYVTGSHLFKFKWHMAVQEVLGFSCINDTRNGLLLAKPIEEAFDAGFLCFILGEDGEHRVHLLDARLCNVKLTDMKAYPWLKPPGQEKMAKESKQQDLMKDVTQALKESFGDIPTFEALQGKQLQFEGDQRPFKRCLAFQASQSRHSALSQGRISPSAIPEVNASAWSHNSYLERIKVCSLESISSICIMETVEQVLNGAAQDYLADPEFQYQFGPIDRLDSISELGKLDDSG
ncbi:TPA: hypothetical protein ACH3X1_000378 [Trebouxia sp. C0004]